MIMSIYQNHVVELLKSDKFGPLFHGKSSFFPFFFDIDTLFNARKKISKTLPTGYEKGKNQPKLVWTP